MKKNQAFTLLLLLASFFANAQEWNWTKALQSEDDSRPTGISVSNNNIILTGYFRKTLSCNKQTIGGKGQRDIFLLKLLTTGEVIDFKCEGSEAEENANALATDISGNIYVCGSFTDTSTLGEQGGVKTLISKGGADVFLAKYSPDFKLIWAKNGGGELNDEALSIATDIAGNIYITGYYSKEADFEGTHLNPSGDQYDIDCFIAKYNQEGTLQWIIKGGGNRADEGTGITTDTSGNCFISGFFQEQTAFTDKDGHSYIINSQGFTDAFLIKVNTEGHILWIKTSGGPDYDCEISTSVIASPEGIVYQTGNFNDQISFSNNEVLHSSGFNDIFIAGYHTDGSVIWTKKAGGTRADFSSSITLDKDGYLYVGGTFTDNCTFGEDEYKTQITSENANGFVAKYNSLGNLLWVRYTGGSGKAFGGPVCTDNLSNSYLTGSFEGNIHFDTKDNTSSLSSNVSYNPFIGKISSGGLVVVKPELSEKNFVQITPNPVKDVLRIHTASYLGGSDIIIYNLLGEQLYDLKAITEETFIDFSSQPSGIYFIKIASEKENHTVKIVK